MGCGDTGTRQHYRTSRVREVLSYWCCFWRASGSELHCWKLRVLPSSLFISSRWAFFSASMAAEGDNEKWGIRLCQLHGKHTRELAMLLPLWVPRSVFANSSSFPSSLRVSPPLCPHSRIIMLPRGLTQGTVGALYHFCQPCPPTRMCWSHTQRHDPISFTIFTTPSPPAPQEREAPKLMLQGASASHQHSQQCGSR